MLADQCKYAFGERIHAGRTCLHAILISCEHSLLAGEACLQTKVCIRRENSCRHGMPPFLRAARGGRVGAKQKTRITTKAPCTHLWRHSGSFLVIHPKRKPFSHAFGFGFGKTVVSASELCSVVLILLSAPSWGQFHSRRESSHHVELLTF